MAFRSLEALQRLFASNPEIKNAIEAVARDGYSIMTMPQQVAGHVARTYGKGIEGIADIAGDIAGFAADVGPRLEVGKGDAEIDIPLPITAHAKMAEGIAGLAEKGGEALSEYETPLEKLRESALAAMDRRIAESMGQVQPEKAMSTTGLGRLTGEKPPEPMITDADESPEFVGPPEPVRVSDQTAEEYEESPDFVGPPEPEEAAMPTVDPKLKKRLDKGAKKQARQAKRAAKQAPEDEGVDVSGAAKAVPVVPDDQAEALFETVHGGPFDPNSSMDRGKLEDIKKNLVRDEYRGLTPNQFALKMYREAA